MATLTIAVDVDSAS